MKKIGIYIMSILALAFTSCDNYDFINPDSPMNPQEALLLAENVNQVATVGTDLASGTLNLSDFKESANGVNVINFGTIENMPEGYNLAVDMEMSKTEDFATSVIVPVTMAGNAAGYVNADEWNKVYTASFSKSPKAKDIFYRYIVYVVKDAQKVKVGDADSTILPGKVNFTPYPSSFVIEDAYYILGTLNDWSVANALKFDHEGDVYDNPVFTMKVDISEEQAAAGWWWKIVPESTKATGNWVDGDNTAFGVAVNGDESLEGMLVGRTATVDCGAGCIKQAGQWLITINLEEGTYSFTSAVDYLYTPGDANGWNQGLSQKLSTSDYANYAGYAVLAPGGFKFSSAPDWDHTNYGLGTEEGTLSTANDAGNLTVAEKGLYYCNVNIASLTYSLTHITTYGVIGDATPGGWDSSTALTPADDFLTWSGDVELIGGKEFKFRANDGWDFNIGGALDNLVQDGGNIAVSESGTYHITLSLASLPYSALVEKK